jgi:hypothetical protein
MFFIHYPMRPFKSLDFIYKSLLYLVIVSFTCLVTLFRVRIGKTMLDGVNINGYVCLRRYHRFILNFYQRKRAFVYKFTSYTVS